MNYSSQYYQVINFIKSYLKFVDKLYPLATDPDEHIDTSEKWYPFKDLINMFKLLKKGREIVNNIDLSKWKHLTPQQKNKIEKEASDNQKNHAFYEIAISDYPDHHLSKLINKKFKDLNHEVLLEIHEARKSSIQKFKFKKYATIWFAVFGYLLTVIPQGFVEVFFHYNNYVVLVTAYLVLGSIGFTTFWYKTFRKYFKERKYSSDIRYLLKYSKALETT